HAGRESHQDGAEPGHVPRGDRRGVGSMRRRGTRDRTGVFLAVLVGVSCAGGARAQAPAAPPATTPPPDTATAQQAVPAPAETPAPPNDTAPITARNRWRYIVIHHSASVTGSAAVFNAMHRKKGWDG